MTSVRLIDKNIKQKQKKKNKENKTHKQKKSALENGSLKNPRV